MAVVKYLRDWLDTYKNVASSQKRNYASQIRKNVKLKNYLYEAIENECHSEIAGLACQQLYEYYRSDVLELKHFSLEFIPVLVWLYLSVVSQKKNHRYLRVEAYLLGIYNLEVADKNGVPRVASVSVPSLSQSSVYHEPPSLATLALTESTLLRYSNDNRYEILEKALPQVENICAQNRMSVLSKVISSFNADITALDEHAHESLCMMALRVAASGFENFVDSSHQNVQSGAGDQASGGVRRGSIISMSNSAQKGDSIETHPRIFVGSRFLIEVLNGLYYVLYNGGGELAVEGLEAIHSRACFEQYADVLLMTQAIKHTVIYRAHAHEQDVMGLGVEITPSGPAFSKQMITNASFRTKRLPEDIDVVEDGLPGAGAPPNYDECVASVASTSSTISNTSRIGASLKQMIRRPGRIKRDDSQSAYKDGPRSLESSISSARIDADQVQVLITMHNDRPEVRVAPTEDLPTYSEMNRENATTQL